MGGERLEIGRDTGRTRGREGRKGKRAREREGRRGEGGGKRWDPQGLVHTPMLEILKNTLFHGTLESPHLYR